MSKRKAARRSSFPISPLHPSLHFILFLLVAFLLVLFVAFIMKQTSEQTRAFLICPQSQQNPVALIEDLSVKCPDGVMMTKDANGCSVWVCKTPKGGKP